MRFILQLLSLASHITLSTPEPQRVIHLIAVMLVTFLMAVVWCLIRPMRAPRRTRRRHE